MSDATPPGAMPPGAAIRLALQNAPWQVSGDGMFRTSLTFGPERAIVLWYSPADRVVVVHEVRENPADNSASFHVKARWPIGADVFDDLAGASLEAAGKLWGTLN